MENSNYNNDGRNENSNASGAANYETGNSQPESSSTYSYSYLNQEQKNPNNIWRAEENTASAYSSSAQGAAGNAQPGAGKAYGNTQNSTDSGYASYHYTQPDANDSMHAGMNGAYGSTGSGTYGSTQSGTYGTAQNQAYSTQSADSMGQGSQRKPGCTARHGQSVQQHLRFSKRPGRLEYLQRCQKTEKGRTCQKTC